MNQQWGIFNDEAAEYTEDEAVVAGFWSELEAKEHLAQYFSPEDECFVQRCVDPDDEPELDDSESAYGEDDYEWPGDN